MTANCMYCGQFRTIDENEVNETMKDGDVLEECTRLGRTVDEYLATVGCDCDRAKHFAYKQEQIKAAYANVEYLLEGKEELLECAKKAARLVAERRIKKVSFGYGNTNVKICRGKEEIKVEKVITTKESLEN